MPTGGFDGVLRTPGVVIHEIPPPPTTSSLEDILVQVPLRMVDARRLIEAGATMEDIAPLLPIGADREAVREHAERVMSWREDRRLCDMPVPHSGAVPMIARLDEMLAPLGRRVDVQAMIEHDVRAPVYGAGPTPFGFEPVRSWEIRLPADIAAIIRQRLGEGRDHEDIVHEVVPMFSRALIAEIDRLNHVSPYEVAANAVRYFSSIPALWTTPHDGKTSRLLTEPTVDRSTFPTSWERLLEEEGL